jgi:hypothetical protein
MHPDLPKLLADIHRRGGTFEDLLRGAIDRGVPLEEVVEHVEFWEDRHAYEEDGSTFLLDDEEEYWLDTFCAVTGGDEAAQAVLDRASGWMTEVTVAERRAKDAALGDRHRRVDELRRSVQNQSDANGLYAAVEVARRCLPAWAVDSALADVLKQWPLGTLTQMVWLPPALQRAKLVHRGSWTQLLDHAEAEVGPDLAATWIARVLEHPTDTGGTPGLRYLKLAWELRGRAGTALWEPVRRVFAHEPPDVWIPAARELGFPASQCVLMLLDAGTPIADVATTMAEAGWSDAELLDALRENGVGPSPALDALRRSGWSAPRMADALRRGGALEPEVREALRALGVPLERIRDLLAAQDW